MTRENQTGRGSGKHLVSPWRKVGRSPSENRGFPRSEIATCLRRQERLSSRPEKQECYTFSVKKYELVIFDLDGTLAPSKSPMEHDMAELLSRLLDKMGVVVISGGSWSQFEKQFLASANFSPGQFERLFLAPTSGASFFRFANGKWHRVYAEVLSREDKKRIFEAFDYALPRSGYVPPKNPHGELIEDRVTQVSFSALGQKAPLELKEKWDPDKKKRLRIVPFLQEKLPDFEVRIGGTTTIDITKKGVDKAYGIKRISDELEIPIEQMLFVGDALFEGGNDEAAKKTGIDCRAVRDPKETEQVISELVGQ